MPILAVLEESGESFRAGRRLKGGATLLGRRSLIDVIPP